MLALGTDLDPVRTGADGFGQRLARVELLTHLVEVGDIEFGAEPDRAGIRFELPQQQPDQGALAGTVGADQPEAIAAQDGQREILDQGAPAETHADVFQFRNQLAAAGAAVDLQAHVAKPLAAFGALGTQALETAYPPFIAGTPGLDALTNPNLLLGPELVEFACRHRFRGQLLGLACLVGGEIPRVGAQPAAIELDDAGRKPVQEGAVVGDHDRGRYPAEQILEQRDAGDIEVVGGLVEQQQIGFLGERQRQCGALALAARGPRGVGVLVHIEAMRVFAEPCLEAPAFLVVMDIIEAPA